MAHSARSKSKLRSKSEKVTNPNSDYFKTAEARRQRLAQKLKENSEKQNEAKEQEKLDNMEDVPAEGEVTTTPIGEKKIDYASVGTHGWRKTRTANYKKKKAAKTKNKAIKF